MDGISTSSAAGLSGSLGAQASQQGQQALRASRLRRLREGAVSGDAEAGGSDPPVERSDEAAALSEQLPPQPPGARHGSLDIRA